MARVAIFDYGAGNILSLRNALEREGAEVGVVNHVSDRGEYDGVVLPGVGHFDPAARRLRGYKCGLVHYAMKLRGLQLGTVQHSGGVPVLGICLGMEAFFERSEEGSEPGLGIIAGDVVALPGTMKSPHMGWNSLRRLRDSYLLEGVEDGAWVYYVHSYMARPASPGVVVAESDYGVAVPAVVEKDNFVGTQFHPEKSGPAGRSMIRNFLRRCSR